MTVTVDDHIAAGSKHAQGALDMLAKAYGRNAAKAHCAGFIAGARSWLISEYGTRETYNLFQGLADSTLERELDRYADENK